jgi:hypothetical protein
VNLNEARRLAGLPELLEAKIKPELKSKFGDLMDAAKMSADDREGVMALMQKAYSAGYADGYNDSPKK